MKDVIKLLNAVQRCTAFSKVFTLNEFESGNAGFEPACELPIGAHERVERARKGPVVKVPSRKWGFSVGL